MALEDRFYRKFLKILTQIHEKGTSVFSTPSQFPFVFFLTLRKLNTVIIIVIMITIIIIIIIITMVI